MGAREDYDACRALLAQGSKSFDFASRLLPARLRDPVAAFYGFCRVSDDAVDEGSDPEAALIELRVRLDGIFAGDPADQPVDRALSRVVEAHGVPRGPIDALLEGYAWDAFGRRVQSWDDLVGYSARVAASVGVVMTLIMGRRERSTLARAIDLGVAMQVTNICRDVGEDARNGRVYLPASWLAQEGIEPESLLGAPRFTPALGRVVRRALGEADVLYARAERGIAALPDDCRAAIGAAARIYAGIGDEIEAAGYDSVSRRATTSRARKTWLAADALRVQAWGGGSASPDPPLEGARFLLDSID